MSERGYLDEVPLRLTSKFYPQPRPQFREVDIHIPVDALQDDYDFSFERSVLVEVKAWDEHQKLEKERRIKEAERLAEIEAQRLAEEEKRQVEAHRIAELEAQRLAQEEEQRLIEAHRLAELEAQRQAEEEVIQEARRIEELETQRKAEEEREVEEKIRHADLEAKRLVEEERKSEETRQLAEIEAHRLVEERIREETRRLAELEAKGKEEEEYERRKEEARRNSPQENNESGKIEESKRTEETKTRNDDRKINEMENPFRQHTRLNFSDFESDTANPFDNVELKSINEMEVLASVLKNDDRTGNNQQNQAFRRDPQSLNSQQYEQPRQPVPISAFPGPSQPLGYPQFSQNVPPNSNMYSPQAPPHPQWNQNPNYFLPGSPSAPDLSGRINNPVVNHVPPTSNQSNVTAHCTTNSFTTYHFPFLTSMADTRSLRDRQNQFSTNLNQSYNPLSSSANQASSANQNPFLSANCGSVQQFPILGSLSQPTCNQLWTGGGPGVRIPMSYNPGNNPVVNGPITTSDPVLKNSTHMNSSDLPGGTSNGTHNSLR